jgi:hypothetical protein
MSEARDQSAKSKAGAASGGAADEFYVGYLPVPRSQLATLRLIVPALLLIFGGAIVLLASVQRDPGDAVWREEPEEFTGTLLAEPVPMLVVGDGSGSRVLLLVEEGKHGAGPRASAWHGKGATIRGLVLTRERRTIVELVAGDGAIRGAENVAATVASVPGASITLRGEIIDSKCYHGAMKPGEGKTHKACATLCVRNGIPAMLATPDASGGMTLRLLVVEGGMDEDTLSKIGEAVEVSGEASRLGDLDILTIKPGAVRRVGK